MACALSPVSSQLLHIINKHTVRFAYCSSLQHVPSSFNYKVWGCLLLLRESQHWFWFDLIASSAARCLCQCSRTAENDSCSKLGTNLVDWVCASQIGTAQHEQNDIILIQANYHHGNLEAAPHAVRWAVLCIHLHCWAAAATHKQRGEHLELDSSYT